MNIVNVDKIMSNILLLNLHNINVDEDSFIFIFNNSVAIEQAAIIVSKNNYSNANTVFVLKYILQLYKDFNYYMNNDNIDDPSFYVRDLRTGNTICSYHSKYLKLFHDRINESNIQITSKNYIDDMKCYQYKLKTKDLEFVILTVKEYHNITEYLREFANHKNPFKLADSKYSGLYIGIPVTYYKIVDPDIEPGSLDDFIVFISV